MDTATLRNETTSVDLPQLVAQGRTAYEHKRTKECLELARQVLHSDPENADAKALQAAVSTDIQRDLTDARALLEDAERMEDGHKYRKAAEIILLKILYLDPAHIDAKALLATAKASTRRSSVVEEIGFTAHPEPVERKPQVRSRTSTSNCHWSLPALPFLSEGYGSSNRKCEARPASRWHPWPLWPSLLPQLSRCLRRLCLLWKFHEHLPVLILRQYPARSPFLLFPQVSRSLR